MSKTPSIQDIAPVNHARWRKKMLAVLKRAWQFIRFICTPQNWFVLAALIFGLIFTFATPIFTVPDEAEHFYRGYQLANGHLLSQQRQAGTGGDVAVNFEIYKIDVLVYKDHYPHQANPQHFGNLKLNDSRMTFVRFDNTALYNPVPYIPHIFAVSIGKGWDLTVQQTVYLVRILNLLFYIILVYYAIRLLPFGKWAAVVIGLLPMHILLAASMSGDPMSTALSILFVAVVLKLRTIQHALPRTKIWLLALLVAATALTKLPFPLLLGLLFFVPARIFGGRWRAFGFILSNLILATALCVGWTLIAKAVGSPYGPPYVDQDRQIAYITRDLGRFVEILWRTFIARFNTEFMRDYVLSIGGRQGWLPYWVSYAYAGFVLLACLPRRPDAEAVKKAVLAWWQKVWVIILALACIVASSALLYISWSKVGARQVDGLQPRYFTPLLILLVPLAGFKTRFMLREKFIPGMLFGLGAIAFLVMSLMAMLHWGYSIDTPIHPELIKTLE